MTEKWHRHGWRIDDEDDIPSNPRDDGFFYQLLERRLSRRGFLGATSAAALLARLVPPAQAASAQAGATLGFTELSHDIDAGLHVPPDYSAQVLLRWGDPLFAGLTEFDPRRQTAASQRQRFGYNNDFVGLLPLPADVDSGQQRALLLVNHEYSIARMMFPGSPSESRLDREQTDIEMAAHGITVVEIVNDGQGWSPRLDSQYNRRITAETEMRFAGPVAGHARLNTTDSDAGRRCFGTVNNCAGGVTPWGTLLSGEENYQKYFLGDADITGEQRNYRRSGVRGERGARFHWGRFHARWNLDREPLAANQFGWIVELDPLDPASTPKKRTALGRFCHEGANVVIASSGHAVAYSGDDSRFEYLYRFVSRDRYDPDDRQANLDLLDHGVLSVARFHDDGTLRWHPLVFGQGPLTAANGFAGQADVLIEARRAADLLKATPMDRPEDVEVNPVSGSVFVMLTNNAARKPWQTDAANPRSLNLFGHIIEIKPDAGDHSRDTASWDFFILAGNPALPGVGGQYHPDTSAHGWFIAPDNCAFDNRGRLWIATDGGGNFGVADGLWVAEVEGQQRALSRHFLTTPVDAELCGPWLTSDDKALFCAVQHPGSSSSYDDPNTRWPDFDASLPPRPSVVVVSNDRGLDMGS